MPCWLSPKDHKAVQAWDTLFWFAILVGMSGQLNSMGVISRFSDAVGGKLLSYNLGWQPIFALLNVAYFVLHYMFASQTAHVGTLYAAFLAMMLAAGVHLSCQIVAKFLNYQWRYGNYFLPFFTQRLLHVHSYVKAGTRHLGH